MTTLNIGNGWLNAFIQIKGVKSTSLFISDIHVKQTTIVRHVRSNSGGPRRFQIALQSRIVKFTPSINIGFLIPKRSGAQKNSTPFPHFPLFKVFDAEVTLTNYWECNIDATMLAQDSNQSVRSKVSLGKKFFYEFSIFTIDFPTFLQVQVLNLRLKLNIS